MALEDLHVELQQWSKTIQHGAAWLVGAFTIAKKDIADAQASDPLVAEAVDLAASWAKAKGVPVNEIESVGASILNLAQTVAAPVTPPDRPQRDADRSPAPPTAPVLKEPSNVSGAADPKAENGAEDEDAAKAAKLADAAS